MIILYRMHTKNQKKTYPFQSSCNLLDGIIVSHVHKTTRPLPKFRAAKPTQQIATREQIELYPSQRDFSSPCNITYILIIHSGPVARTVSNWELRTCPECKNRYAKHTCIKALSHGAIFLATCNAVLLLADVKLANTRLHHSLLIYP